MVSPKPKETERRTTNLTGPLETISDVITHYPQWVGLLEPAPIDFYDPDVEWQPLPRPAHYCDNGR